ncbi:FAD-binding oxidoreductase [Eubacterium sp.]|uniref:FAD-binding oxidoreductase n=1 Tax=Eubacterium sp. TaxID=142586 RepID=UPI002FC6A498
MNQVEMVKDLAAIVGEERVMTDAESIELASRDYIGFRRYHRSDGKQWVPKAACVIKPKNTQEVSAVMAYLNGHGIDAVPRTGGSSVTMGLEPAEGGVIIDGSEMNQILEIDETNRMVTAQCGTPLEYLEEQLNARGYTTGHYPQSLPLASLGGLVATRSIGQFSTLYGGIEDLLVGLEAVLADGSIVRIKNVPRRSTGPDLRHLFIGSEGMMGFVTEVTMKLFEYKPENRWMRAYGVVGMDKGLAFIRELMVEGYKPAVIRLHDQYEVAELMGAPAPDGHAMLLFIAEGPKSIADATGAAIAALAETQGLLDLGTSPVEVWLKTRNDNCANIDKNTRYLQGIVSDTTEISGNWDVIGKIYNGMIGRLHTEIENLTFAGAHSSHSYLTGTNIYCRFIFKADKGVDYVQEDYMKVVSIIMEETLKHGGSIAHHHGSGKYRTRWMPEEHGTSYPLMYKIKEALDPKHILNKGVLLVEK